MPALPLGDWVAKSIASPASTPDEADSSRSRRPVRAGRFIRVIPDSRRVRRPARELTALSEFIPAMYLIMRDGEPLTVGRFSSTKELLDQISKFLPTGVYRVYRLSSRISQPGLGSSFWGEVTNHAGESVTYRLRDDPERLLEPPDGGGRA